MEQDMIIMQDIFRYKQLGIDQNGRAYGQFEATGVRPTFVNRLEAKGIKLPSNLFQERILHAGLTRCSGRATVPSRGDRRRPRGSADWASRPRTAGLEHTWGTAPQHPASGELA